MDKLQLLEDSIAHALGISPDTIELRFAGAVIAAYRANGQTDGARAQQLADTLLPVVQPFLPASGPIGVIIQLASLAEPFVGKLVDWTEMHFAKTIDGVDLQDSEPVNLPT